MGFFSSDEPKTTRWGGFPIVESAHKVTVTFSDWSDATPLSSEEREEITKIRRGAKTTKLTPSQQRGLKAKIDRAKAATAKKQAEAELIKKAKAREAEAKRKAKMAKKTGTTHTTKSSSSWW